MIRSFISISNLLLFLFIPTACHLKSEQHDRSILTTDEFEQAKQKYSIDNVSGEAYATHETHHGLITNNVWNQQAADKRAWHQGIVKRTESDTELYGWTWTWPTTPKVVFGYPQVKRGRSPWHPEPFVDERFPLPLEAIDSLIISIDLETIATGNFNVASSMWIVNDSTKHTTANPSIITAEVMFWTYATSNHFSPAGKKIKELTINGEVWEVWHQHHWKDVSGEQSNRWTYLAFRVKDYTLKKIFNAAPLLHFAVQEKLLSPKDYISDIELGNEVMGGQGITWLHNFQVDIYP